MTVEFISEQGGNSSADFQTLEVVEADEAALLITALADGLETAH